MNLIYKDKYLYFGKISLQEFIKNHPTPFYLYDLSMIKERARFFKIHFPGEVHYAMKANSNPHILSAIKEVGLGLDVVSQGEIKRALSVGFLPEDILFSGVGKTEKEIQLAIELGLKSINVESEQELVRIKNIAQALRKKVAISFRLNPQTDAKSHPFITTGLKENKFGINVDSIEILLKILSESAHYVELCGLSIHIGSQIMDLNIISEAIIKTIPLFKLINSKGYNLKYFDIGGGLGVSYSQESSPTIEDYSKMAYKYLGSLGCKILCEPGRVMVAPFGLLVTKVEYIKKSDHKNFIIVDTGIHHLMRPALYNAFHNILPLKESHDGVKILYDVVGPLCESSDVLGKDRAFSKIEQGDFLAIADVGAYGFVMASHYNDQPLPAEFIV